MQTRYGLALSFGRVFGLLLVSDEPVSLDLDRGQTEHEHDEC